jgi:RND family efflux transporter MFP subunit
MAGCKECGVKPIKALRQAVETSLRALGPPASDGEGAALKPAGWRGLLRSRRARYIAAALAALLALSAWFFTRPPAVTVTAATRGEAVDVVYATGVVEYVRQARIAPIVTAPIQRVVVEEGGQVRAGQLLAQLEDGPQRGTVAQLEAQALTARLAADRVERLYDRGFASRAAWDEARGQRDAAVGAARSARARLADYAITAPFAGTVLRRDAEPGNLATPGSVLFVVADESSIRVTADLDERDIARVAEGQDALIRADAFPGQTFAARVTEVTPQGEAATRVFRTRLGLDSGAPLRAGMTVEANIIAARRADAVLAPAAALRQDAVFVVEDGRARRRPIVRGATGADRVEIRDGVREGELVIVNPPDALNDGQRVRVRRS